MIEKTHSLYRPPAEADSLIVRIADGCPWNGCTFCGMYKGVNYQFYGLKKATEELSKARKHWPDARRIFLADGDVMHLDFQTLEKLLIGINDTFKNVTRVSLYANGTSILAKTNDQLRRLKELKLHTLYMGLESGHNETLQAVNKRETAEEMCEAGQRAQAAGLRMSVMILTGLAGELRSGFHARATAEALNQMQPRLLSALRVIPVPGTPLHDDGKDLPTLQKNGRAHPVTSEKTSSFQMLTEHAAMVELREIISHLELNATVFRADHSSNSVPLEARFPKDKQRLLSQLDALLASQKLDPNSPGRLPWSL